MNMNIHGINQPGPINNIDFNLIRKPKTPIIFNKYGNNNFNGPVKLHNNQQSKKPQSSEIYLNKEDLSTYNNRHHLNIGGYHAPPGSNAQKTKKSNLIFTGFKRPSTAPQKDKLLKISRPVNYMNNSAGFNTGYTVGLLGPNKRVPSPMIASQNNNFYNRGGAPPDKFRLLPPSMVVGMGNNNLIPYKSKKKHGI